MKTKRTYWLMGLFLVASLAGPAMLGGCSTNPATGEKQLSLISREQEIAMGEEAAPVFEEEFGGAVDDPQLQEYVSFIGQKVAARAERPMPYEFTLVRSDVPNAFALPGGKIFITAGLMGIMENERELAAVLGHEVGHVAAQHNVDRMQKQMGAQVLIEVVQKIGGPDYGQAAGAATEVAATMAMLSYSRGDELWADKLGIRYMEKAGYNPYGMVELLTHLGELDESEKSTVGELFRTHPYGEDRVEQARTIIRDEHPRYSPDQPDPHREDFLHMRNRLKSKVPGV